MLAWGLAEEVSERKLCLGLENWKRGNVLVGRPSMSKG
jgi:hypothetical protein